MLGENDGPSMIAYASDGAQYGLGFFVPFIPRPVRDGVRLPGDVHAHRRRHPPRLRRARAAALRQGLGLVRRRRPHVHQPRHADRRVRRHPRRACLLPPRRRRGGRPRAGARRCSPSAAGATGAGSGSCSAWRSSTACSWWPRSWSSPTSAASSALSTSRPFPGGSFNTLLLLLASTIGATVTPWMIFFQQSASADKGMTPSDITHGRYDTAVGRGARGDLRDRRADRRRGAADPRRSRASRGSPAPASPRPSSTSPAAPRERCSRSG